MGLPTGYFAFKKIEKEAEELRRKKGNTGLTREQAIVKVCEAQPELVRKYREEAKNYG